MYKKNYRWLATFLAVTAWLGVWGCQKGATTPPKPLENMLKYKKRCHSPKDAKTIQQLEQRSIHSIELAIGYQMCGALPEQQTPKLGICGQEFLRQMQRRMRDIIYFPHLDSLSPEEGAAIQHLRGKTLLLPDLQHLSTERASQISCFQGDGLSLASIKKIDTKTALALSSFQGTDLSLDGLQHLDVETARALRHFKGKTLSLDGLENLSADTAQELSAFKGNTLSLSGLQRLPPTPLQALQAFQGNNLLISKWVTPHEEDVGSKPKEDLSAAPDEVLTDEQLLTFVETRKTSNLPSSSFCASGKVCLYQSDSALSIVDNRTATAKYSIVDYGYPRNPIRLRNDGSAVSYEQLQRRLEATVRALGRQDRFTDLWIDCYAIAIVPRLYHREDIKRFAVPKPSKKNSVADFQVMTPSAVNERINDMRASVTRSKTSNHFAPANPAEMRSTSFQNPRLRSYRAWAGWNHIHEYESYFVYSPESKNVYFVDHRIEWKLKDKDSAAQRRAKLKLRTLNMLHELKLQSIDIETWNVCECDFITGLKNGIDVTLH